uniref:Macaca fascicularis brain cDNA clone: QflA-20380, similar to human hypothetical protein FLJ13855 (FLJ13855), mRNA, RefSeq: NM_023079.2 n=1 Tax=Macaca fascicularis TaxID=9541 RepID=I7GIJ5_MACFA|nr:unnamed protein product [Macaca fascicularis]
MARTKQARIPGCGSGGPVPGLTSLALEHLGRRSSVHPISGAKVPLQEHLERGPLAKTKQPTHLSTGPAP